MGFLGGSDGKELTYNVGDLGLIPGLGRSPGGGHGSLLQYSFLESPHGQRSLAGYSPYGCKELDMNEWLSKAHLECKPASVQNGLIVGVGVGVRKCFLLGPVIFQMNWITDGIH